MPYVDQAVQVLILLGVPSVVLALRRRGARGRRLVAASASALLGYVLLVMMTAHNVDVVHGVAVRGVRFDGTPFRYDFHAYALLLLGAVLTWPCVLAARLAGPLGRGEAGARGAALRVVAAVLAVCLPLIPVHACFGVLISAVAAACGGAVAIATRPAPRPDAPALVSALP